MSPSSHHLLHTCAQAGGTQVLPGLLYQGDVAVVRELKCDYKLVTGYSGWAGGQLDGEIRAGYWSVKDIKEAGEVLRAKST